MSKKLRATGLLAFATLIVLLATNCSKPVAGEKELLGKIKGKASLRLADGSTISRDDSDEYSPYLIKLSDGYLVLVFGSNRDCGACDPSTHNIFMAKSLTAFDGEFIPFFNTPLVVQPAGAINAASQISFAAKASGTNVILYVNNPNITTGTYDPANPTSGSLTPITNSGRQTDTIIGISGDGSKIYSTEDVSGTGYAFDPAAGSSTPFGYGLDGATSATQVRQENSGYDDAILGVYYSSTYAATGAQYFGPIIDLDTSLAFSGLSITSMSTFSADDAANDIVLFSAFDYFGGFTQDLYVITSHTSKDLWDAAGFPGLDFSGGAPSYPLRIFVTYSTYQGNLGGIAGADAKCNDVADLNNPNDGSTYKALLGISGVRDLTTDWPLMPDNPYFRTDLITYIEMTDQFGDFPATIANAFDPGPQANSFSGMQAGWITSSADITANCNGWTGTANNQYYAIPSSPDMTGGTTTFFYSGTAPCTTFLTLMCVEQPFVP